MRLYIGILFLLVCGLTFSQEHTYDQSSAWFSIIADAPIHNNFYGKTEMHIRRTHFLSDWQQFLLRPSVHYKLNPTVDFAVGYTYIRNHTYAPYTAPIDKNENNIWQQITLSHKSNKVKFKHRFRYEERFIDKVVEKDGGYALKGNTYANRFRYRFTTFFPLLNIAEKHALSAQFFDEIWLNQNKNGILPKGLNQNWFYAGLAFDLSPKSSVGIGYLNDYLALKGDDFEDNNILQTTLVYHF
ncbi:DUF2490 domain-containing protein [Galbibacter sp. EGI 63066]|uniref:DUF2490 domain-containing protein n=1 Tax=Galbibacter sp. EGI 63066 TaxID=2993559 RepID=UPI002248EDCD|nr:DUF2490 domain-containing protein [Galbibacter sp. EGI 63066]MCX2679342.1 DUF2490 domain-containing protein [Galbibacter sp. EGI 63066]